MYTLLASLRHLPRFLIVAGGRPLLAAAVTAPILCAIATPADQMMQDQSQCPGCECCP